MPRYLVERSFADGLRLDDGASSALVERNGELGVTWLQSFVTDDRRTMFCVYEAPTPEAIRRAARANGLPVDRIAEVRVLDPYPYA